MTNQPKKENKEKGKHSRKEDNYENMIKKGLEPDIFEIFDGE